MHRNSWRMNVVANLRRLGALSRTTPELDSLHLWLVHRPKYFLGIILSAPIVFCISALRPLVLLRFGVISSERIGAFAPAAAYVSLIGSRVTKRLRTVDFVSITRPVSNLQIELMLKRHVRIMPAPWLWLFFERACFFWTRSKMHQVGVRLKLQQLSQIYENPEKLAFTSAEEQEGRNLVRALGIPADSSWVCIHNRDSKFLASSLPAIKFAPNSSWAFHSYRDFNVRCLSVAAEELADRGYYVLRMGAAVEEGFVSTDPRIIDYASTALRSDFADIYLLANCAAYLGSDSGIFAIPLVFGKPTFLVNFPLAYCPQMTCTNSDPFIPKHLWHPETQHFLALREVFELKLLFAGETRIYDEAGVELICNTPEEIRDLAVELDERLKGIWSPDAEDERLQTRFWEIFRQYCPPDLVGGVQARIGSAFLRQNRYLLD